jgi:hypothetical protein
MNFSPFSQETLDNGLVSPLPEEESSSSDIHPCEKRITSNIYPITLSVGGGTIGFAVGFLLGVSLGLETSTKFLLATKVAIVFAIFARTASTCRSREEQEIGI